MAGWNLLLLSLLGGWLTLNVYRPSYVPGRLAIVSFFAGWLTAELALHQVTLWAVVTGWLVRRGALGSIAGNLGLGIMIVSCAFLLYAYFRAGNAAEVIEGALAEGLGADHRSRVLPEVGAKLRNDVDWKQILMPFPIRHPEVERVGNIAYHRARGVTLRLDVYRHRSHPTGAPVLLEVHGGGWVLGSKNEQGLPLMMRMSAQGWVCVSADYRLSPHATFPEHLIDLKRALQWIREHVAEYGGDPGFVVVAGQSAGGHLASLLALTRNQPEYQPGFEQIDSTVRGCISFYGVYDFTDRHGAWPHDEMARLLERQIMKASLDEDREAYERASPMSQLSEDDPPFFVIHGDRDTLVPVEEARRFCTLYRQTVKAPLVYAEIPGAQHAFEIFPSLRGELVLAGVERFLAVLYSDYRRAKAAEEPAAVAAAS